MQSIEINSVKVIFNKEKTQNNITLYNEPCDCQYCKNYYKNIKANFELVKFLNQFGIDYLRCEEVISYDLGEKDDSFIHSMAYYDVFGKIERDFSIEKEDYTILFQTNADVNAGHEETEYFWIIIDAVIPYVLEEKREIPYRSKRKNVLKKIREQISLLLRKEDIVKHVPVKPGWESVVRMMYDTGLDAFGDEVVKVVYSKDKSMRYVILRDEQSIFTYQLEAIYQYDDEEWQYICNSNDALPAMWEPHYDGWCGSRFNSIDDLMKALIYEPEYKQFFE